jgi:phosphatidylinositol glycan class O
MDDDTVLMIYGDHGMTEDGNHGGGSQLELKTVLFAYTK